MGLLLLLCSLQAVIQYTSFLFSSIYCIPYKIFLKVDQYEAYNEVTI